MSILPQVAFVLVIAFAGVLLYKRIVFIRKSILLGKPEQRNDRKAERWPTMGLVAFGQRKMFKRIIPAILHLFIYVSFIVINLEVLEFVIDGVSGGHRTFAPYTGGGYGFAMNIFEFLAVAVLLSCIFFLTRRNIVKVPRLKSTELRGWPELDANLILIIEILLMCAILTMNATDQLLADRGFGNYIKIEGLLLSGLIKPLYEGFSTQTLVLLERFSWWFHIIGILGFAVYIAYSKHLHIFLAFPNTWYSNLNPKGEMKNMPE